MSIEFRSGALRLKPSLRVRLHGRSRLPDLALAFTLATTALFFGVAFSLPADGHADGRQLAGPAPDLIEMRSAASIETRLPVRTGVRMVGADTVRSTHAWSIGTNAN